MFNVEVVNCKAGNVVIKVDGKEFMNVLPPRKEYIQYLQDGEDFNTNVFIELSVCNFVHPNNKKIYDILYYPNEFIRKLMHESDFDVYIKKCNDCIFTNDSGEVSEIPVYEVYIRNFSDHELPIVAHIATINFVDINDEDTPKQIGVLFKDKIAGGLYAVTIRSTDGVNKADELLEEYDVNIEFES